MKTYILATFACMALIQTASAQLVLNDFSAYDAVPATSDYNYSNGGWTPGQGVGVMQITNGTGQDSYIWGFNTAQNFSAYTQVQLTATLTGGNTSSFYKVILADAFSTTIAEATFLPADLTGVPVLKTWTVFGDMSAVEQYIIAGDNLPTSATRIDFDNLALVSIPEPSTYALLALGLGAILFVRRRTAKA